MTELMIGIDPGKDETGIVLVDGKELLAGCTISRKGIPQPDADYLSDIAIAVREYLAREPGDPPQIAVEAINPPSPHMGLTNPSGAIGTAKVLGAVLGLWGNAFVVDPGGNGSAPCHAYPPEIRSKRCQGLERCACKGTDGNRHVRSAYDVALIGHRMSKRLPG